MKLRTFILLAISLLVVACSDYEDTVVVDFKNASSYDITFVQEIDKFEGGVVVQTDIRNQGTIKAGESLSVAAYDIGAVDWWHFWPYSRINSIRFGESVKIDIGDNRYGNFEGFTLVESGERFDRYTYTFTDEDYQYALEHGTKLELGE